MAIPSALFLSPSLYIYNAPPHPPTYPPPPPLALLRGRDYIVVALLVLGLYVFMNGDAQASPKGTPAPRVFSSLLPC